MMKLTLFSLAIAVVMLPATNEAVPIDATADAGIDATADAGIEVDVDT